MKFELYKSISLCLAAVSLRREIFVWRFLYIASLLTLPEAEFSISKTEKSHSEPNLVNTVAERGLSILVWLKSQSQSC